MTYNENLSAEYIPLSDAPSGPTRIWNLNFEKLKSVSAEFGLKEVTKNNPLYSWISQQRKRFKTRELSNEEFSQLKSIRFIWDPSMEKWDVNYKLLANYYLLNDGLEPSYDRINTESESSKLNIFVMEARKDYKKSALSDYKIEHLSLLNDFSFEGRDKTWFKRAEAIQLKIESTEVHSILKLLGNRHYIWLLNQHQILIKDRKGYFSREQKCSS